MIGFGKRRRAEQRMAEWLAHPNESGVVPAAVRHRKTYRAQLITQGRVDIELVEYVMPDGSKGRGFVNGALTWSFLGDEVGAISDDDLLEAYCGWAWLFPAIQGGSVKTTFESPEAEARFHDHKASGGVGSFAIASRFRIGTSVLFEYEGVLDGKRIRGAGNTEEDVFFAEDDPRFGLPAIYFLLGRVAVQSMSRAGGRSNNPMQELTRPARRSLEDKSCSTAARRQARRLLERSYPIA